MRQTIESIAWEDLNRWLGAWNGAPADKLLEILHSLGLKLREEVLPGDRLGLLDIHARTVILERYMEDKVHARSDLGGLRNFTIAHEVGHWQLHLHALSMGALTEKHEQQAQYYAGCLLAPRALLEMEPEVEDLRQFRSRIALGCPRGLGQSFHYGQAEINADGDSVFEAVWKVCSEL